MSNLKPQEDPVVVAKDAETKEAEEVIRFTPEEEATLLSSSQAQKAQANAQFASSSYTSAIETYNQALHTCPNYLDYEIAVLKSNIAACHLNLKEWKGAVKSATEALESLDKVDVEDVEEVDEEIVSEGAMKVESRGGEVKGRKGDVERIRAKALMRRARARAEAGGWSSLQGAEEDYKTLSEMSNLDPASRRIVNQQLKALPPKTKEAQEKEMGEMMGKLKQLGNGILSPFGLSTDNFQMIKDEKTGGYSMNFNQGA